MGNAFYDRGKHDIVSNDINWLTDTIKCSLVSSGYTFSAGHTVYSDISGSILSGASDQTLAGKSVDASANAKANSASFSGVSASQTCKAVVVWKDDGGAGRLLAYFDTGPGFPLTTTGATITVDWNNTASNGVVFQAV
jgi:hypothetical protein